MDARRSPTRAELAAALDTLAGRGWFATRDPETRALIGAEARLRFLHPGEYLYRAGDPPNGLFGLVEGSLRIAFPRDDGEELVIYRADPGFWIGDLAQLADSERLVSVSATTRTLVVQVSTEGLDRLVTAHPELWRDFYALTNLNFRTALRVLANMLAPDSERRVALRLLHQHEEAGEPAAGLAVSQAEFAQLVGLSVPTLQRILRRLAEAGLVEVGYGRVRVLDRSALLRRCAE